MIKTFVLMLGIFTSLNAISQEIDEKTKKNVMSYIKKVFPNKPTSIKKSPIKGLYMVFFDANLMYISADGRYVFEKTPLIDLKDRSNFTEKILETVRKKILAKADKKSMITFSPVPPQKIKRTLTVVTDIDCPYCQKFHSEIDQYLKNGIQIRYLLFPRAGINSQSFKTAKAVLCSKNQQNAMTKAKRIAAYNARASRSGNPLKSQVSAPSCKNSVKKQMQLVTEKLGLDGSTPQIILQSGELIRGYVPYDKLLEITKQKKIN